MAVYYTRRYRRLLEENGLPLVQYKEQVGNNYELV